MSSTDGTSGVANGVANGVNNGSDTTPVTHLTTRSVSDHTLRNVLFMEDLEEKRVNGNGKCAALHVRNGHRLPSYVGISCAISGYSDYNRYCSSVQSRNSCTRRDISVAALRLQGSTPEAVNRLNESLNRKNSLISEALITSRHNVNEDEDIRSDGTEEKNNGFNSDSNNKNNNSLLEQRIASLYGQTFAKDWRESRTKTRHKLNNSCIFDKQRSPSCPPIRKPTPTQQNISEKRTQTQSAIQSPTESHPIVDKETDNRFDTHSKLIRSDHKLNTNETVEQFTQIVESVEENSKMKPKSDENQILSSSQSISTNENSSQSSCAQSRPSTARDGNWFLTELNKTTQQMREKIDLTEEMLRKEDSRMNDEIAGKLRAAVGKANLLIKQKFKQFEELCLKNISQTDSEQFVTTNDDLEGFWDMVSIQVVDINDTFAEINKLEESGWKLDPESIPKKMTSTPTKPRSRKSTPKGSPDKSCDELTTGRDSERRNRLREAKRKARLKASQTDDEITIFIPTNNKE